VNVIELTLNTKLLSSEHRITFFWNLENCLPQSSFRKLYMLVNLASTLLCFD